MARSELLRLLHACKHDPEDATARLVLADWLEEHGDDSDRARAEFIRLQLAHEGDGPDWRLTRNALFSRHHAAWLGECLPLSKHPGCERGLVMLSGPKLAKAPSSLGESEEWAWVETVGQPGDKALASPLLGSVPALLFHCADMAPSRLARLGGMPARPRSLQLNEWPESVELSGVFDSPLASGLESLAVTGSPLSPQAVATIAALPALRRLDLRAARLGNEGMAALAQAAFFPFLHSLRLSFCSLNGDELERLRGAAMVRDLRLDGNRLAYLESLGDAGFRDILERLSLSHGEVRSIHLARLAFPRLRGLDLTGNDLASVGRWPILTDLETLVLDDNPLDDRLDGLPEPGPRFLNLANCSLRDKGAARLAAWPGLGQVEFLDVRSNGISLPGIRALAESSHPVRLTALDLTRNPLGKEGLAALVASPLYPRLRWLRLAWSASVSEIASALAAQPSEALRELQIDYDAPSADLAKLRRTMPNCLIG